MTAPTPPLIEARGLHRFYRRGGRVDSEVAALRDVTLAVHAGEMVAVIGPSGSGKSTLLTLLAGLENPDGGSVWVAGERMSHRAVADRARLRARRIGVMTQASGLFAHLSVVANVQLAASLRPAPRPARPAGSARSARSAAMDLLERLGIGDRAHARPSRLSGGETARANLAVALAGGPSVLLVDEPTAEVSRDEETSVLEVIRAHRPPGGATVVVTHSPVIAGIAGRVVELSAGKVR